MIMSVSYAPTKLRLPVGFEHLLEALAREVLREQPKDIIIFAAEYFKRKLVLRDEGALDSITAAKKTTATVREEVQPEQVQSHGEQDIVNTNQSEVLTDIDVNDPELNKAAATIQAKFRSHLKQEGDERNQIKVQAGAVDQDEAGPNVLPDFDLDDPQLNKAASVIQTNFRTYLNEKNKTTEQEPSAETQEIPNIAEKPSAETQAKSEVVEESSAEIEEKPQMAEDDTEPVTSLTQDPEPTKAESTVDEISLQTEESNADEQLQVPPPLAEVQEETKGKEDAVEENPEPSSESQEKLEQERDTDEAQSQPLADKERLAETVKTEGEEEPSKETEAQEGDGDSKELPGETVEDSKEGKGDGSTEIEPAVGDDVGNAAENQEQTETTGDAHGNEQVAPEEDEATGDTKAEPSDETS